MRAILTITAVVTGLCLHPGSAAAVPIQLQFQSFIHTIDDIVPAVPGPGIDSVSVPSVTGTTIEVGDFVSGTVSYDPALATITTTSSIHTSYDLPLSLDMTLTTASEAIPLSFSGTGRSSVHLIGAGTQLSSFRLNGMSVDPLAGAVATVAGFDFRNTFSPFDPNDPFAMPDSVTFSQPCCTAFAGGMDLVIFDGSSTWKGTGPEFIVRTGFISVQTVPEPTSLTLLGLGVAGALAFRRRT